MASITFYGIVIHIENEEYAHIIKMSTEGMFHNIECGNLDSPALISVSSLGVAGESSKGECGLYPPYKKWTISGNTKIEIYNGKNKSKNEVFASEF